MIYRNGVAAAKQYALDSKESMKLVAEKLSEYARMNIENSKRLAQLATPPNQSKGGY